MKHAENYKENDSGRKGSRVTSAEKHQYLYWYDYAEKYGYDTDESDMSLKLERREID